MERQLSASCRSESGSCLVCSEDSQAASSLGPRSAAESVGEDSPTVARLTADADHVPAPAANPDRVVATPWLPEGAARDSVSLAAELTALYDLLRLTSAERRERSLQLRRLRAAVCELYPNASVSICGSFAYGCPIYSSTVDVVCDGLGRVAGPAVVRVADRARLRLQRCDEGGGGALLAVMSSAEGSTLHVRFEPDQGAGELAVEAAAALAAALRQYPAARPVLACVRTLVGQLGSAGALSGYCVALMVLHTAQRSARPHCPAQLLVDFFALFSAPPGYRVRADSAEQAPADGSLLLHVEPIGCGGCSRNAAAGATEEEVAAVLAAFADCSKALAAWGTPASSVYGTLWERADAAC
eukprot:TRINITY_DN3184_c1_g2_i1.p1 TRINITY_DN3184_c1_g2~~TRINITY_DN3184_c1_g2_i1.p1  ORF type:complete len:391 (+),score=115.12 TRINITY_DN3184_c1_g2_i1:103-1173(+)